MTETLTLSTALLRDRATRRDLGGLAPLLAHEHPADLATLIDPLDPEQAWAVLALLPLPVMAETFGYFDLAFQADLVTAAPRSTLGALVTEMNADDRADLFNELTEDQQQALLPALAQAEREDLRRLASYEEYTAGAIMTSDYAVLSEQLTAAEALDKLRREAPDKETIYRTYVTDGDGRLIGSVRLQSLILAAPATRVSAFMERRTHAVRVDAPQEEAAKQIAKYDILAVPVVDNDGRLVGIVTHDDATDVLEEETTEDIQLQSAVAPLEESLRDSTPWQLYRARVFWLVVLVFGNILSGMGIAAYEDTIAAHVALVFFLPLLIASGGNAGSQSSTLMVRALSTGDVGLGDIGWLLGRELLVAGLLGLTMAAAVSGLGFWRGGWEIAVIVAGAMVLIVLVGALIGLTLPFVLTRLKLDPATASGPLVTSIADVSGVLIYFAIATLVLFH
jgi:magnesium transporter